MDKLAFVDKLVEYRCILEEDKSFFLTLFDNILDDEFKIIEGDYHVVDGKGTFYPAIKVDASFFGRRFECTFYEDGCHFQSETDNDYVYFYCEKDAYDKPMKLVEFDYSFRDGLGYYCYVYRNNYVHFLYLNNSKVPLVSFDYWEYDFKLGDERKLPEGVELDMEKEYVSSNMQETILNILQNPHHAFDK